MSIFPLFISLYLFVLIYGLIMDVHTSACLDGDEHKRWASNSLLKDDSFGEDKSEYLFIGYSTFYYYAL